MQGLYIGLMSGTSLDGVDGVLAQIDPLGTAIRPRVLAHTHLPFDADLRDELLSLNTDAGGNELHRSAVATWRLMRVYADVSNRLLAAATVRPSEVVAIGAHGQTVRHRPRAFGDMGYTRQLGDGALLAEWAGIDSICDFRSADIAAGGHGAPLVPAFHAACWSVHGQAQAVLNIGGIANLTLLHADGRVGGFDTGPGNLLMDLWCRRAFGTPYDANGTLARSGQVLGHLLAAMLRDPYFSAPPPKSTGRDDFHAAWLDAHLRQATGASPQDVLCTLAELTAHSVAHSLKQALSDVRGLLVCGGGAHNAHLLERLAAALQGVTVRTTASAGIPPDQVEALAFAWLAARRVSGLAGNRPEVTGARGPRVLGAWHRAVH